VNSSGTDLVILLMTCILKLFIGNLICKWYPLVALAKLLIQYFADGAAIKPFSALKALMVMPACFSYFCTKLMISEVIVIIRRKTFSSG